MFGGFRTDMSDIMFIKTERYLHEGVAYVPHMSEELLSVSSNMESIDHNCGAAGECDHESHQDHEADDEGQHNQTVIRSKQNDFRGFIGRLHRRVKPYRDSGVAHGHSEGQELLPWFRVMTLSDPGYIPGYTIGAWWLKSRNPDKAVEFADEGIEKNPRAFQIHLIRGEIMLSRARESGDILEPYGRTRELIVESAGSFRRAAELAVEQRPDFDPDGVYPEGWTTYMDADAWNAVRMSTLMESRYGAPEKAKSLAQSYLRAFGEDLILRRIADR